MYYDCLGGNNYLITLKIYRDCSSSQNAPFDSPAAVGIYDGNNILINTLRFFNPSITLLPVVISDPCYQAPQGICVQEAIYTQQVTLPLNPTGYHISYQRCCRNAGIVNIVNPGEVGATYTTFIPPNALTTCNSSPRFKELPPLVICNDVPFLFDHSATDPNGDSLVYSFYDPTQGGTTFDPAPAPPVSPPYIAIPWENGYQLNRQIPGSPDLSINASSGILNCLPSMVGLYVYGVKVDEYRNGVLFSTTHREFQTTVTPCPKTVVSSVPDQQEVCAGFTVRLKNNSANATSFSWNFGDPNNPGAGSTDFEPTYTYSDTGTYVITLIANPGMSCADTALAIYRIHPPLDVKYENPGPKCLHDQNLRFEAEGNFTNNAVVTWDFGINANRPTAIGYIQNGISFDTPGTYAVTVTVSEFGCTDSYTDSVRIAPLPFAFFVTPDSGCAPYTVSFENLSKSPVPMSYTWSLGDGNFSTEENPRHTYKHPGSYDVSLTVFIDSICQYTDTYNVHAAILVNPSPQAGISADPLTNSIYYPNITFFDESQGATEQIIYFADGRSSPLSPITHTYSESGYYNAYQWVINEFGCTDTAQVTVFIEPDTRVYIPNAFTPNGDGVNDIFLPVIKDVLDYEIIVFNRWGQAVFTTVNPAEGWDGKHQGKESPVDVYVYKLWYSDWKNIRKVVNGHVTLIR